MQIISRDELRHELDSPAHPLLVEVLAPQDFREFHLPSAINVPIGPRFDQRIQLAAPDKDRRVVVYCRDRACTASEKAADAMERAGYRNVVRYREGKDDWKQAGLPVEHQ